MPGIVNLNLLSAIRILILFYIVTKNLRTSCNCIMEYILEMANQDYINVYFLGIVLTGVGNFSGIVGEQNLYGKNSTQ